MIEEEKDGHGLDKRSRIDQKRAEGDNRTRDEDLLEQPFPFLLIPFPDSFDT